MVGILFLLSKLFFFTSKVSLVFRSVSLSAHHGAPDVDDGAQERAGDAQLQGGGNPGPQDRVVQGREAHRDLAPESSVAQGERERAQQPQQP